MCVCVCAPSHLTLAVSLSHTHARPLTGGMELLEIWTDVDPSVECQRCHGGMTALSLLSE